MLQAIRAQDGQLRKYDACGWRYEHLMKVRAAREGRVGGGDGDNAITKDGEGANRTIASHVVTSNLDSTIMQYKLFCVIPDGKPAFVVNIDETETVADLKDKIKEKKPLTLATVETEALELYRINAFGNNLQERRKALEDEIRRIEDIRKASSDSELDNLELLEVVFNNTPPPHKTIHILVVVPSGEPAPSLPADVPPPPCS